MSTRALPASDVFASCPLDGKILEYYAGTFDAVYISLNPFIRSVGIDVAEFRPGTYPRFADIVTKCRPVPWAEVKNLAGLPSLAAVDVGLRTGILGLRKEFQNDAYVEAIEELSSTDRILTPTEGLFSPLVYDRVLESIQASGYEWLWVGDEFCTERKLRWIDELRQEGDHMTKRQLNLFTPDKQLLWTTHWDSHFSFLCSTRETLARIVRKADLEGFFCSPSTEVYWSVLP